MTVHNELENMTAGEISQVIETEIGYHLLFLKARKKSEYIPLDQIWDQIRSSLFNEQADKIRKEWIKVLRSKAFIKIVNE